jgi:hypothetical protein
MFFSNTDLPVPDGPMMAVILPRGMSKVMPSSTVCDPKRFVTPRREMIGSGTVSTDSVPPSSTSSGRVARLGSGSARFLALVVLALVVAFVASARSLCSTCACRA